jgi:pyruvate kinase
VKAKAIVGMTRSGYTAHQISHCRPKAAIYVFTPDPLQLTTLNLLWGVNAFLYDGTKDIDATIDEVDALLSKKGLVQKGDVIINTAAMPLHNSGLTNMIKVSVVK